MKNKLTVELRRGRVRWYYHVKHDNGQIVTTSQKYYSKINAKHAALGAASALGCKIKF